MNEHNRNLVITGFMGTGKSSVGRLVAERMGREFVDSDALIERRAGRTIPEIFEQEGEAGFRALEAQVCQELSAGQGWVVATGGWTLGSPANRAAVEEGGLVVCLHADVPTLIQRLSGPDGRPMLQEAGGTVQAWRTRLETLLVQRQPTYRSFPLHVDTSRLTQDQAARRVLALWQAFAGVDVPDALPVMAPDGDYAVLIGEGLLERLGPLVNGLGRWTAVALVSDDVVGPLHAGRVAKALEEAGLRVAGCTMRAGEAHKTLETVSDLYTQFLAAGLDRSGLVVALGGGVVGDVAGFAAATYMRGLPLVQVPTTLLAMVDSSVGGKTGVDLPAGKNLVGAFKQPRLVVIDPGVLATLPAADFRAGLAEVVKAGVIGSPELFARLEDGRRDLAWIIRQAVAVKVAVVEVDPYEGGRRAVLNLGHTFAHAFERLSNYQLRHGQAVAMGMAAAARLAVNLGHCPPAVGQRIVALLDHLDLPTAPPAYDPQAVWEAMASDKKKRGARLRFVLPLDIGRVDLFDDVPREAVLAVLKGVV
ncbi:MAG: bifunctional shikimate kinase/3-dehydroquinate synthase [Anaerolineae bacterium]